MRPSSISPYNTRKLGQILSEVRLPRDFEEITEFLHNENAEISDYDRLLRVLALLELLDDSNVQETVQARRINELAHLIGQRYLSRLKPHDLQQESKQNVQIANTAEVAFACLQILVSQFDCFLNQETLIYATAYTDANDPWSTKEAASLANALIGSSMSKDQIRPYVVDWVLPKCIRPAFSGATSKVSLSGRLPRFPQQAPRDFQAPDRPVWKHGGLQIISVARWVVDKSDKDLIRDHWPLFTPVLLTISDDQDTGVRLVGLEITASFLKKCPAEVLKSTGIGDVFEDAVLPSVLYLPSLTPAEESVKIMSAAYETLQVLVGKESDITDPTRRALLDRIFRNGVFPAYEHAANHLSVVGALMSITTALLNMLGIFSAKHLPRLFSIISSVLTDPFNAPHLGVLVQTTTALNALIANCWPRIVHGGYDGEATRVIAICWLNVTDGESGVDPANVDVAHLKREFKQTEVTLRSLRESKEGPGARGFDQAIEKESSLGDILSLT